MRHKLTYTHRWGRNRTILAAIFTEPSIRCAVVAFGSFHEDFEKTGGRIADEFALKQYNAAIRHHLANIAGLEADPDRIDSYVASCIIFVSIEILQGHYQSALSLVKGAVKLFYKCNSTLNRSSAYPLECLENLLSRLQSQAVGLIGFKSIGITIPPRLKAADLPPLPGTFTKVAQAKEYIEFYSHMHTLSRTECEIPVTARPNSADFELYLRLLTDWSSAFENLVTTQSHTFTEMEQQTVTILRIWQTMTAAGIAMHLEFQATVDDQTLWDHFEESSRRVVVLAEQVLKFTHTPTSAYHKEPLHQFTLDIGIVAPLYDTARVCRDPLIRRKAINLLRQYPCREGLWDSLLAARAAERQMEIEESAVPEVRCAADIPGWARVTAVLPTFHLGERWCEVEFKRTKFVHEMEEEWVCRREVFEW